MFVQFLILLIALSLIILGAKFLVDASSLIAKRLGISEFIIGATIIGIGTSMPELVVSFTGALVHNSDIALGNVVGSNIFNGALILGLVSVLTPLSITKENLTKDIPINIIASLLILIFGLNFTFWGIGKYDSLSRIEGLIFILIYLLYLICSIKHEHNKITIKPQLDETIPTTKYPLFVTLLIALGGLLGLIFGGKIFVNCAIQIAKILGVSDRVIAITLLAGGTSLPELATCVVAAIKKKGNMALGNILGSNVANILLILGGSALIDGIVLSSKNYLDVFVVLMISILVFLFGISKSKRFNRLVGLLFILIDIGYMIWITINTH